jgi:hypothetical protein
MSDVAKTVKCDCEVIRASRTFAGWVDFDEFSAVLKTGTLFTETPVLVSYSSVGLEERWYRCRQCRQVWRLVEPDPPFSGIWEMVA